MPKAYPQFRSFYLHEQLVEHFLLTPAELQLVLNCRGDANRCGMALLLKTIAHLGYVPDPMPPDPAGGSLLRGRSTRLGVGFLGSLPLAKQHAGLSPGANSSTHRLAVRDGARQGGLGTVASP